jgi:hypothetical protein
MVGSGISDSLLQRTLELCSQLSAGESTRAVSELPGMDSLLLDALARPLTQLIDQIGQLRAGSDAGLLQPLRALKQTAEHSLQLLRSTPMLSVQGPHIRLHPDSIMARFTTLHTLAANMPNLQARLEQLHAADGQRKQQGVIELQSALTHVNSQLRTV